MVQKVIGMSINLKEFESFLASDEARVWDKGNDVLYEMCKDYPTHENVDEIIAKTWLIGRSYAAAIERRKNAAETSDAFYIKVGKLIKESDLDKEIGKIPNTKILDEKSIAVIYKAHYFLTEKFFKLTHLNKISLASKYLHFHKPIVPIYDSRSARSARLILEDMPYREMTKQLSHDFRISRKDRGFVFLEFLTRMHVLQNFIMKMTGRIYTMRDIDKYFLKLQEG